jgi:hypothetical protein
MTTCIATAALEGHRFPRSIVSLAVWLHHRFEGSQRNVEDLLAERGIIFGYETIRTPNVTAPPQPRAVTPGLMLSASGLAWPMSWPLDSARPIFAHFALNSVTMPCGWRVKVWRKRIPADQHPRACTCAGPRFSGLHPLLRAPVRGRSPLLQPSLPKTPTT